MKPILIQGAENSEINYFFENLENKKEIEIGSFRFWAGEIKNHPVVVSRTKVGEVNAATATAIGIMKFEHKCIINQGTAGSHSREIHRGDIVIGKEYFGLTNIRTQLRREGEGVAPENWVLREFQSDDDEKVSKEADSDLVDFIYNMKNEYTKLYKGITVPGCRNK